MTEASLTNVLVSPQESGDLDGWKAGVFEEFHARMTDKDNEFPCIFGVEAVTRGTLRYGFVSDEAGDQATQLSRILRQFTEVCHDLGKRTSLVCFFESWNADSTHAGYWRRFWQLLGEVSEQDSAPWPPDISQSLDDPQFEFAFNGQPMFVVVNTELHEHRLSRRLSRVAVTFQPRFVFDDIAEGTPRGDAARAIIRGRFASYDTAPLPENLGSFGDVSNREWNQYYLDDGTSADIPASCPFDRF
ncbi:hypothetical protein O159_24820 [Leifsonia xyli subsp. cynodontis DSM 46306]|uniref:YqcI/YcgG family protein n=1 Tax=Leifsonia xyli subsp. cynodontis DSM 46306 TaxID=1389489 RepID=U3PFK1_LEIXC|nr:YqcI/YcgG family protein [Leifsonia xyli]AGW42418.1 hypothetical protein O159_24820 [Leifsonia xyli subsp. cynodontis DSM 46306]